MVECGKFNLITLILYIIHTVFTLLVLPTPLFLIWGPVWLIWTITRILSHIFHSIRCKIKRDLEKAGNNVTGTFQSIALYFKTNPKMATIFVVCGIAAILAILSLVGGTVGLVIYLKTRKTSSSTNLEYADDYGEYADDY